MTEPYPLRAITQDEFEAWARMIADTYGEDRPREQLANERLTLEFNRTIGAFDGGSPVGGAAAFSRTLTVPGALQPIAGISWVGVAPTHRRRGILTAMMRKQLAELHESGGEALAALNASEATIYGRFGYGVAGCGARMLGQAPAMDFRPGVGPGPGEVRLLDRDAARPVLSEIYEEIRTATVGWLDRPAKFWETRLYDAPPTRGGATALRFAVYRQPDGTDTGYVLYRLHGDSDETGNRSAVRVVELAAATRAAYAGLWRFLTGIDLFPWISYEGAPDEPLLHMLADPRAVRVTTVDRLWVRLVDVDRALAGRRYAAALDVVLQVDDAFCPWNAGCYRLEADRDSVRCQRTKAAADLRLTSTELGAVHLGGTTLASLAAAGRVEELRPGTLAACSAAFRGEREPVNPTGAGFPCY